MAKPAAAMAAPRAQILGVLMASPAEACFTADPSHKASLAPPADGLDKQGFIRRPLRAVCQCPSH
jgi:hypothetical protein